MARIIGEVRPQYAFIENSPKLTLRGLDIVLCDLAEMGFNANWGVVSAADVGAPHLRERIWIMAHSNSNGESISAVNAEQVCESDMAHTKCRQQEMGRHDARMGWIKKLGKERNARVCFWTTEPNVGRVANGVASRVDRLKAIGNGQVPAVAATAFQLLSEGL